MIDIKILYSAVFRIKLYFFAAGKCIAVISLRLQATRKRELRRFPVPLVFNPASSFGMKCAQCGNHLIAPEWSEYRNEWDIRHVWRCPKCDCCFKTIGNSKSAPPAEARGIVVDVLLQRAAGAEADVILHQCLAKAERAAPGEGVFFRRDHDGIAVCCARAESGHAVAPAITDMNSRLLIAAPQGSGQGSIYRHNLAQWKLVRITSAPAAPAAWRCWRRCAGPFELGLALAIAYAG
jgi:hypothetical protein